MKDAIFRENPLEATGLPLATFKIKECITYPLHYHSVVEWVYVYEGALTIVVNHKTYVLGPGEFMNIGSHHIHLFDSKNQTIHYRLIRIDLAPLVAYESVDVVLARSFKLRANPQLAALYEAMDASEKDHEPPIAFYGMAIQLLQMVCAEGANLLGDYQGNITKEHQFIEKVNAHIYQHYNEGLSLESVAEAVGYNKDYLSRKFFQQMGMHFKDYVKLFMIARTRELLESTDKHMTDIAYECGFKSVVTFNRAFKDHMGMTPRAYRMSKND